MMSEYHVGFNTLERRQIFVGEVADTVAEFIKHRFTEKNVDVIVVAVLPDHIHMQIAGDYDKSTWRNMLCHLQMEITNLLHKEYPEREWPENIWVYNWWFRRVEDLDDHFRLIRYIKGQPEHHHIHIHESEKSNK